MRVSKRFPLAVHSLLFVAVLSPKKRVTSALVAESTRSNPVTVRNIFLNLSDSGLLIASAGKTAEYAWQENRKISRCGIFIKL